MKLKLLIGDTPGAVPLPTMPRESDKERETQLGTRLHMPKLLPRLTQLLEELGSLLVTPVLPTWLANFWLPFH